MERMTVAIEWKATGDDGTLEGYASTFGNVDLGDDVIEKGAFADTIGNIKTAGIPLLADHVASTASVLGTIYDAREDRKGLYIKARFSSAASAQDVRTKLVEGHLNKMSIGYEPVKFAFEEREGKTIRVLQQIKLWETSVVVFPMNPEAAVSRVKCLSGDERKALAEALAEAEALADGASCVEDGCEAAATTTRAASDDIDESVCEQHATTELPAGAGSADEDAEARHAEAGGTEGEAPAGDADPAPSWDHYASEALLAGEDPEAIADPAQRAGLEQQLELVEQGLASLEADPE